MSISEFENCYEQGSPRLPNFSSHGYQVVQQLGHNEVGDGRGRTAAGIAPPT